MKVRELTEMLSKLQPDAEVRAWDPEEEEWAPVTGAVFTKTYLYTDTDDIE